MGIKFSSISAWKKLKRKVNVKKGKLLYGLDMDLQICSAYKW